MGLSFGKALSIEYLCKVKNASFINSSIDKMVKDKFLTIYNGAIKEAKETFKSKHLPNIKGKDLLEQVKYIKNEISAIDKKAENFTVTPYFKNHSSEEWLLKCFASRTTLLNVDESKELHEGVFWGKLNAKLSEKKRKLLQDIAKYTYEDFLNGKNDPIFFELGYGWHIEESEYEKIMIWQAEKVIKIVSLESQLIIQKIQGSFKDIEDPLEIISKDKDHYDNAIIKGDFNTPQDLIASLQQLSFLSDYNFSELDNEAALTDFNMYQEPKINWGRISKNYIDALRDKYNSNKDIVPFSNAPVIFYSIAKVMAWMEKVLNGTSASAPFQIPDFKLLQEKTIEDAKAEAEKLNEQYDQEHNIENLEEKEVERLYIHMLDQLRHEFNDKGLFNHYFGALQREEGIDTFFATNCFFGNDEDEQAEELRKAVILQERIYHYMFALWDIAGKNRVNFPDIENASGVSEIMFLMHSMVLDTDLHEKMGKILDDFMRDMHQFRLPIDLVIRNSHEQMHDLFYECINRLLEYLEDSDPGNKVLYIHSRLKQLRQRELDMRRFENEGFVKCDLKYTGLFKEYLELEADFIRETKDVNFIAALKEPPKQKRLSAPKKKTFGFKHTDTQPLLNTIKQLCLKISFLNEDKSTPEQLSEILTAKELNGKLSPVYFGCETTQVRYILDKLKPYFISLTLRIIEESGLFYSKSGTLLTAQNLSASKIDNPKDADEINAAFTLLQ